MVKIFFGLPSSLSAAIICDWLNLKSACRLDTATCAQKERSTLLDLLHSVECVGHLHASNNAQLQWMNKKRICSWLLFLSNRLEEDDCQEFLQRSGRYVRWLSRTSLEGGIPLQMVVQHCRHLVRIRFTSRDQQGDFTELLSVNPNLVEITLTIRVPLSVVDIKLPNLKYLQLRGTAVCDDACVMLVKSTSKLCYLSLGVGQTSTSAGLIEATRHCPLLRYFEPPNLPDIDNALQQVTQSCVHIEYIRFFYCTSLTNAGIAAVARNVKSLRTIQFTYSPNITNTCLLSLAKYQCRTLEKVIVDERLDVDDETEVVEERETFNVEAVTALRAACTNLKNFDWQRTIDADGDGDNAGEIVATHLACADRVTTLSVFQLDDAILYAMARHCAQLRALNLRDVNGEDIGLCSDTMLLHMVENCTSLNTIAVSCPIQRERLQGLLAANARVNITDKINDFHHGYPLQL